MLSFWTTRLGFVATLVVFAVPLFVGLDRWDLRNDEAIYSYAVERMLDTGDWLTPRYIPTDYEFLEKPPLKMWLVAGLMKTGLVPRDELGMRLLDAVFGTILFAYVFAFGARLAGPICGGVAVLLLFTFEPLLFDHGLRSNNMEGALTLAYAGGLWHAMRWGDAPLRGARHAWIAAAYFVLGFMTKYVAVIFLPIVATVFWLWRPGGLALMWRGWRQWVMPAVVSAIVIAPWFVYQSSVYGWAFWDELLGRQVLGRFTAGVDPSHLQPWHFYVSETWRHFTAAGSAWLVGAGAVVVGWRALARRDVTARLLLAWWVLPVAAITLGSSKLLHYVFPFLPPLAVAGGAAVAALAGVAAAGARLAAARVDWIFDTRAGILLRGYRVPLAAVAVAALGLAVWTLLVGPVDIEIGGIRVLRNSSAVRPALVGTIFLMAAGGVRVAVLGVATVAMLLALPIRAYGHHLDMVRSTDRPLEALGLCLLEESRGTDGPGIFVEDPTALPHPFYYYLRHTGPWRTEGPALDALQRHIIRTDSPSLVLLHRTTWLAARSAAASAESTDSVTALLDAALDVSNDRVLLVPVRYWRCLSVSIEAGGVQVEPPASGAPAS